MAVDMFHQDRRYQGRVEGHQARSSEIDVLAWSWGEPVRLGPHGQRRGAGKVNVQDLSLTKYIDKASCDLICLLQRQAFPEGRAVGPQGRREPLEYLKLTMEDLITSVSTGGSGGEDRLTENVSLNFAKVQVEYSEQQKDGSGKPVGKSAGMSPPTAKYRLLRSARRPGRRRADKSSSSGGPNGRTDPEGPSQPAADACLPRRARRPRREDQARPARRRGRAHHRQPPLAKRGAITEPMLRREVAIDLEAS